MNTLKHSLESEALNLDYSSITDEAGELDLSLLKKELSGFKTSPNQVNTLAAVLHYAMELTNNSKAIAAGDDSPLTDVPLIASLHMIGAAVPTESRPAIIATIDKMVATGSIDPEKKPWAPENLSAAVELILLALSKSGNPKVQGIASILSSFVLPLIFKKKKQTLTIAG